MSSLAPVGLKKGGPMPALQIAAATFLGLFGLVMTAAGIMALARGSLAGLVPLLLFGLPWVALAAWSVTSAIRGLIGPALLVDDAGIHNRTTPIGVRFIPWEQALGFYPGQAFLNSVASVVWATPGYAEAHMGGFSRAMGRMNAPFGYTMGAIDASQLPVSSEQLCLMLLQQRRARRPELPEAPGMPPTLPLASPRETR